MSKVCQKYVQSRFTSKNKGLMPLIKEVRAEYAAQKIKFLTSTVVNGHSLPS